MARIIDKNAAKQKYSHADFFTVRQKLMLTKYLMGPINNHKWPISSSSAVNLRRRVAISQFQLSINDKRPMKPALEAIIERNNYHEIMWYICCR